ncbi:MAG: sodium dependent transporter [Planctomycetaceae bacterium TMED241]|nr:bile acid:sodium symporter [Synechococcus sp. BS301-5m-G54]RPG10826.1 MAG: sodium dependent transporter [Planctomycetaceae bacterium TMED241]|tara:strand:- start:619 stop:1491 length:873 start_codon:yes stop_codon:yes gene_type:complete
MSLLISLALFFIMMSLGLNLPSLQFGLLKRRPWLLVRVLLATCMVLPIVALLLLHSPLGQGLSAAVSTAVMLMAICPSAPMIALKSTKLAANPELATRLQFWSACAAILSVPLWVGQLPTEASETIWSIPAQEVAYQVFTVQLIPLLVGVSLRRWCAEWSERWNPVIQKSSKILLLVLLALILIVALPQVAPMLIGNLRGALLMFILTWIALGLGFAVAGDDGVERSTLPLVLSMRNPGLALLIVQRMAPNAVDLKAAVVGYVVVTAVGTAPFMQWRKANASQAQITGDV